MYKRVFTMFMPNLRASNKTRICDITTQLIKSSITVRALFPFGFTSYQAHVPISAPTLR